MAELRNPDDAPPDSSDCTSRLGGLSRRKKIAIVLFLVLSGYALTDDDPSPPSQASATNASPVASDADLERLLSSITPPLPERAATAGSRRNAATFLASQGSDVAAHDSARQNTTHHDRHEHSAPAAQADTGAVIRRSRPDPAASPALTASDSLPSRSPRLRFTGRIDPLY